jgi:EpsI family protein
MHKPEICYPAQGFVLLDKQIGTLDLQSKPVTAVRLQTKLGQRTEPITYWTVVGDHVTKSGIDKKITEMRYALGGRIPDGMLVRVSSIDPSNSNANGQQNQFANTMIAAIAPGHRKRFAGDPQLN